MTLRIGLVVSLFLLLVIAGVGAWRLGHHPLPLPATPTAALASIVRMKSTPIYYEYISTAGEKHTSEEMQGKVLCILFWSTWAQPSSELLDWLSKLEQHYSAKGFVAIAFALDDDPVKVNQMIKQFQIEIPTPMLPHALWASAEVPLDGLPTLYLINQQGKIIQKYEGLATRERLEKDILDLILPKS